MTLLQPPPEFVPIVDEAEDNRILISLLESWLDPKSDENIWREMERAWENYVVSPIVWPESGERLQKYLMQIVMAYPDDAYARQAEVYALLDDNYFDLVRAGAIPRSLVPFWATLSLIPKVGETFRRDFSRLYRREMRRNGN